MRIGIVNDMWLAAENLRRIIGTIPEHSISWVARDGAEAVEKCRVDTPDLILMDLIMPVMDGVEATRKIMAAAPCAILIVTASMDGNSGRIFEAIGAGALDAVQMPSSRGIGESDGVAALKFKIETLRRCASGADKLQTTDASLKPGKQSRRDKYPLIAIGASAGGPAAVSIILEGLPRNFSSPVVLIQHIDAQFAPSMAAWLNEKSHLPVRIANQGERPLPGTVLMAGTNNHLALVDSNTLGYVNEPRQLSYRPSVDVFFDSVIRHWQGTSAGVLLSGMGRDGAQGLRRMRDAGAFTIAQDHDTCAVYGMPKVAAELGAAKKILPIHEIAGELTRMFPPPA